MNIIVHVLLALSQDELTAEKAEELFVEAYKEYVAEERDSSTTKYRKIHEKFAKEPIGAIAAYNIACNLALDGENDKALEWIKKALEAGYDNFDHLEADGDLEAIREEKGYEEALAAAKKNAPKEKRAPIREEDAPKFAERLIKSHKDGDAEGLTALFSRLGWFGHAKTVEWLNATLKKMAYKLAGDGGNWRLERIDD